MNVTGRLDRLRWSRSDRDFVEMGEYQSLREECGIEQGRPATLKGTMTRETLARAHRHALESRQRIAKQQGLVEELERDGHDSTMAKALLQEFRHSLQLHLISRATIEADLARPHSNLQVAGSPPDGAGLIQIKRILVDNPRRRGSNIDHGHRCSSGVVATDSAEEHGELMERTQATH